MIGLHIQSELMSFIQDRETLREVVAEALGTKTEVAESKPVDSFTELSALFAQAGGQVHS